MLNHFRTLLLDETTVGDADEHLASHYVSITAPNANLTTRPNYTETDTQRVPKALLTIHAYLFLDAPRASKLNVLNFYTELMYATGLDSYMTKFDPRTTYQFVEAKTFEPNLALETFVTFQLEKFVGLNLTDFILTGERDEYLENILNNHFNPLYRLGALVALYVVKFNTVWQTLK